METKTESKHTPRPWKITFDDAFEGTELISIEDLKGKCVLTLDKAVTDPEDIDNFRLIVRAVNTFDTLLEFAKKHHEVCEDCEGTGKIYKHADPTTGQWTPCPYAEAIREAEKL